MTYQEIIDNIQTRIETIIANRFTDTYTITSISASDYNPEIDSDVTVTITLTDQTGDPITNQSVPLYVDNNSITGLTTDNNGQATYTYNCEDWGLHTFTVNGKTIQITVTGWKTEVDDSNYTLKHNQDMVELAIHITSDTSFPTTWTAFGASVIPSELQPSMPVTSINYGNSNVALAVRDNKAYVYRRSMTGTQITSTAYCTLVWRKQ